MFSFPGAYQKTTAILLILSILALSGLEVQAQGIQDDTGGASIFLESRFRLWDPTEKILDQNFTITAVYFNASNNNTAHLSIKINGLAVHNETFKNWTKWGRIYTGENLELEILINNNTVFHERDIYIMSGVTAPALQKWKPSFLEISPGDWSKLQWNQFFGAVLGVLFSIYIGYRVTKEGRKRTGGRQIA